MKQKTEQLWWVTYWVIQNDNDVDFSFEVSAQTKDEAIEKVKQGKGIGQLQETPRLARKFSAIPSH